MGWAEPVVPRTEGGSFALSPWFVCLPPRLSSTFSVVPAMGIGLQPRVHFRSCERTDRARCRTQNLLWRLWFVVSWMQLSRTAAHSRCCSCLCLALSNIRLVRHTRFVRLDQTDLLRRVFCPWLLAVSSCFSNSAYALVFEYFRRFVCPGLGSRVRTCLSCLRGYARCFLARASRRRLIDIPTRPPPSRSAVLGSGTTPGTSNATLPTGWIMKLMTLLKITP